MRVFNRLILTTVVLLGVATASNAADRATTERADKPNLIVVLADDLGAKELSCYGSKDHQTPRLDRMAADGVRFDTFYAMPLCTPTRVALLTGQYGFHSGFLGMSNPAFKPRGTAQALISNHFTIADMMKSAGYATALAGKWQLPGELPTLINDCGFDEYRMWAYDGNLPKGVTHPAHEKGGATPRYWHPSLIENGKYLPTKPDDFGPDMFNEFVLDFARRHKNEPFYVHYTSVLTHTPRVETPDPNDPKKRWPAGLKSNLEYLDVLMGRLVDGLKAEGLDKNTYVIFIGDNGTGGDGKATVTELGARVPAIVYGPGLKRGLVSPAVADLTDIMATAAELSGAQLPTDRPFDGKSFMSVVTGKQPRHREWIYSHLDAGRLIRDERWLLQIPMRGNDIKFFDCGTCRDGSTYKDVTDSKDPEVKAARARFDSIVASLPEPKPIEGATDTTKKERKGDRKEKKKAKKDNDE